MSINESDFIWETEAPQPSEDEFNWTAEQGFDEEAFQAWYAERAEMAGINPDPDDPRHKYDYRAAYEAGAEPVLLEEDNRYHWPSQFKADDHPNRYVDGMDTKTGQPVQDEDNFSYPDMEGDFPWDDVGFTEGEGGRYSLEEDDILGGLGVMASQAGSMFTDVVPETIARSLRGGDKTLADDGWLDLWIKENQEERERRRVLSEQERELTWFKVPFTDIKVKYGHAEDAVDSLGYSLVNAIVALGGRALGKRLAVATGPIGSAIAGNVGGMAAGTFVSGRTTKDQFIEDMQKLWAKKKGIDPQNATPEDQAEWQEFYDNIVDDARMYGFWEAAPETFSNMVMWGIGKIGKGKIAQAALTPIKKKIEKKIASEIGKKMLKAAGKTTGAAVKLASQITEEGLTETVTTKYQGELEFRHGLRDKAPTWEEAFKEVLPTVLITTPIMGGGMKATQKAIDVAAGEKTKPADVADALKTQAAKVVQEGLDKGELTVDQVKTMQSELAPEHPFRQALGEIIKQNEGAPAATPPPPAKKKLEGKRIQELEEIISGGTKVEGQEIVAVEVKPTGKLKAAVKTIGDTLGQPVALFRGEGVVRSLDGVTSRKTGTIYINEEAEDPYIVTLAHESIHRLKLKHRDLYDAFEKMTTGEELDFDGWLVKHNEKRKRIGAGELSKDNALAKEEFIAEFAGEQFKDVEFWKKLQKADPKLGKTLAGIVADLATALRNAIRKGKKVDSKYFKNLNDAQDALAKVYTEYVRREKQVTDETVRPVKAGTEAEGGTSAPATPAKPAAPKPKVAPEEEKGKAKPKDVIEKAGLAKNETVSRLLRGRLEPTEETLGGLKNKEIKAVAAIMGFPASGTKAKMIARIEDLYKLRKTLAGFDSGYEGAEVLAEKYKKAELVAMARRAKSFVSGNKVAIAGGLISWRDRARMNGKKALREVLEAQGLPVPDALKSDYELEKEGKKTEKPEGGPEFEHTSDQPAPGTNTNHWLRKGKEIAVRATVTPDGKVLYVEVSMAFKDRTEELAGLMLEKLGKDTKDLLKTKRGYVHIPETVDDLQSMAQWELEAVPDEMRARIMLGPDATDEEVQRLIEATNNLREQGKKKVEQVEKKKAEQNARPVNRDPLKISLVDPKKVNLPGWTSELWKDRFKKWADGVKKDYDRKVDQWDEAVFQLQDYAENNYGTTTVLIEFEHAFSVGPVNEVINYRRRGLSGEKGMSQWGDVVSMYPADDVEVPENAAAPGIRQILYWLKDSSPQVARGITRNELKGILKQGGFKLGKLLAVKNFTKKSLQNVLDGKSKIEGAKAGIEHLLEVTGLDLAGLVKAYQDGNVDLIERLNAEGKLAPKSKVSGIHKFNREVKKPIVINEGHESTLEVPGGDSVPISYVLMEADQVIPSHDPITFAKTKGYPDEVQERIYHKDEAEQQKVINNARKLKPNLVINNNPDAINGPPIVIPGGVVLGGNSRAMSIKRAYTQRTSGGRYKEALAQNASHFGLTREEVDAMTSPILVRLYTPEKTDAKTLHRLATTFNAPLTQQMTQEATIASLGSNVSVKTLEHIGDRLAADGITLRELLGKKDAVKILDRLVKDGALAESAKSQYVNAKYQQLNNSGKELVEAVILGSIINDADILSVAPKSMTNKIGSALTSLARIKARGEAWDITPKLKDAFRLAIEIKNVDMTGIKQYLAQGSLFNDDKVSDGITLALAHILLEGKQTELGKKLKGFAVDASIDTRNQSFLFEPKSPDESFKEHFAETLEATGRGADQPLFSIKDSDIVREQAQLSFNFKTMRKAPKKLEPRVRVDAPVRAVMRTTGNISWDGNVVRNVEDAVSLLASMRKFAQEQAFFVTTDENGVVLEIHRVAKGDKQAVQISPIDSMGHIMNIPGAKSVYFVHNHPSEGTKISDSDENMLKILTAFGKIYDLDVHGGIIAGTSYREVTGERKTGKIRPAVRRLSLPVKERYLIKKAGYNERPQVNTIEKFMVFIEAAHQGRDGLMLMDVKLRPLAFLKWRQGRQKDILADTIAAMEQVNAAALVFFSSEELDFKKREFCNLIGGNLRGSGVKLVEIVEKGKSFAVSGHLHSYQKAGSYVGSKFKSVKDDALFSIKDKWYSGLGKFLELNLPGKGSPKQIKQLLETWEKKGKYKTEELAWSGLSEWLDEATGNDYARQREAYERQKQKDFEETAKKYWDEETGGKFDPLKLLIVQGPAANERLRKFQKDYPKFKAKKTVITREQVVEALKKTNIQIEESQYGGRSVWHSQQQLNAFLKEKAKKYKVEYKEDYLQSGASLGTMNAIAEHLDDEESRELSILNLSLSQGLSHNSAVRINESRRNLEEAELADQQARYKALKILKKGGMVDYAERLSAVNNMGWFWNVDEKATEEAFKKAYKIDPDFDWNLLIDTAADVKGAKEDLHWEQKSAQRSAPIYQREDLVVPGGEEYTELVLRLPERNPFAKERDIFINRMAAKYAPTPEGATAAVYQPAVYGEDFFYEDLTEEDQARITELSRAADQWRIENKDQNYYSSHWGDDWNVIAHTRFDIRRDKSGKLTMFVQEIQSDWHQAGRTGGYWSGSLEERMAPLYEKMGRISEEKHALEDQLAAIFKEAKAWVRENTELPYFAMYPDMLAYDQDNWAAVGIGEMGKAEKAEFSEVLKPFHEQYAPIYKKHFELGQEYVGVNNQATQIQQGASLGVPDAPYKKTWPALIMRRLVRYAAERGVDQIAWTPGYIQAERYNLRKRIDNITWHKNRFGYYNVFAYTPDGTQLERVNAEIKDVEEFIGKELTGRIEKDVKDGVNEGNFTGVDLDIGGEELRDFYDKEVKYHTRKFFDKKDWGNAKIGVSEFAIEKETVTKGWLVLDEDEVPVRDPETNEILSFDDRLNAREYLAQNLAGNGWVSRDRGEQDRTIEAWTLPITSEMKERALEEGMPLFSIKSPNYQAEIEKQQPDRKMLASIKTYHGSPWGFWKFSSEKINTGEGSQAFGWGLYFINKDDYGRQYAHDVAQKATVYDGVEYTSVEGLRDKLVKKYGKEHDQVIYNALWDFAYSQFNASDVKAYAKRRGSGPEALAIVNHIADGLERPYIGGEQRWRLVPRGGIRVENQLSKFDRLILFDISGRAGWISKTKDPIPEVKRQLRDTIAAQQTYLDAEGVSQESKLEHFDIQRRAIRGMELFDELDLVAKLPRPRYLYKVVLHKGKNPDQYNYLEWHQPMSRQPKGVQEVLRKAGIMDELIQDAKPRWESRNGRWQLEIYGYVVPNSAGGYDVHTGGSGQYAGWAKDLAQAQKMVEEKVPPIVNNDIRGSELYHLLSRRFGGDPKRASLYLLDKGIDGIHTPSGSLSGIAESDTDVHVVFDDSEITIEDRELFSIKEDPVVMPPSLQTDAPYDLYFRQGEELLDALKHLHALELKRQAYKRATPRDAFVDYYEEQNNQELDELSYQVVEVILEHYEEWLERHDSGEGWVKQMFDPYDELGIYMNPSDSFTDGRVGLIVAGNAWRVDVEQEILDAVRTEFGPPEMSGTAEEMLEELENDYLDEDEVAELRKDLEEELIDEEDIRDRLWDERMQAADMDFLGYEVADGVELGSILDMQTWESPIGETVLRVLADEGWKAWRSNWGRTLDEAEDRIRGQRDRLEASVDTEGSIDKRMTAITWALNEQHVYGSMFEHMDLSERDLDELTAMDEKIKRPQDLLRRQYKGPLYSIKDRPLWTYQMEETLAKKLQVTGKPKGMIQTIKALAKKGEYKQDELDWSGVIDWLEEQKGKVTRDQVMDYLAENHILVFDIGTHLEPSDSEERKLLDRIFELHEQIEKDFPVKVSIAPSMDDADFYFEGFQHEDAGFIEAYNYEAMMEQGPDFAELASEIVRLHTKLDAVNGKRNPRTKPKYESHSFEYRLGLNEYHELRLVLPQGYKRRFHNLYDKLMAGEISQKEYDRLINERGQAATFDATHWEDEPNVIAHVRFDERIDENGERVLFLEEVQSDWHQAGRKYGYFSPKPYEGLSYDGLMIAIDKGKKITAPDGDYWVPEKTTKFTPEYWRKYLVDANFYDAYAINQLSDEEVEKSVQEEIELGNIPTFTEAVVHWKHYDPQGNVIGMLGGDSYGNIELERMVAGQIARAMNQSMAPHYQVLEPGTVGSAPGDQEFYRVITPENNRVVYRSSSGDDAYAWVKKHSPVLNGPFRQAWPLMTIKRMVRYAADHGYDRLSWTPGWMQAERYRLSERVDGLKFIRRRNVAGENVYVMWGVRDGQNVIEIPQDSGSIPEWQLEDYVGEEIAERMIHAKGDMAQIRSHLSLGEKKIMERGRAVKVAEFPRYTPEDIEVQEQEHSYYCVSKFPEMADRVNVGKGTVRGVEGAKKYASRYFNEQNSGWFVHYADGSITGRWEEKSLAQSDMERHNKKYERISQYEIIDAEDLVVGGRGMKEFYDKILKNTVNRYFGKETWGKPKVTIGKIKSGGNKMADYKGPDKTLAEMSDLAENPKAGNDINGAAIRVWNYMASDANEHDAQGVEWNWRESFREGMRKHGTIQLAEYLGGSMDWSANYTEVWSLPITDKMKEGAQKGFPLFAIKKLDPVAKQYLDALRAADPSAFVSPTEDLSVDVYEGLPDEVKHRVRAAKGLGRITLRQKFKDTAVDVWRSVRRHRPYLDPQEDGQLANVLRLHQEVPENSSRRALQVLMQIAGDMKPKQYEAFTMKLLVDDMRKDIESGLLDSGDLPFGFTAKTLEQYSQHINKITWNDPFIASALRRRGAFNSKLKKALVNADLLPETVLEDDRYFHHQVLQFRALKELGEDYYPGVGAGSKDVRLHKKGWQRARVGSTKDYNTEYAEAEFEVITQALAQLETKSALNRIKSLVDITDALKEKADEMNKIAEDKIKLPGTEDIKSVNWKDLIPAGYTVWKPSPGSSWYKAYALTDRMVEAFQAGELVLGPENADAIKKILARGKDVEWIVKTEVAKTLDGFDLKLEDHLLSKASRNVMRAWKQWILINPARVIKYNVNNMSGDLDIAMAYDPKILGYMKKSLKDLLRQRGNKLPADIRKEIDQAYTLGVIGSGWSVQEVGDVGRQMAYDKHLAALTGDKPHLISRAWKGLQAFTNYRENILRLAAFRYFKDQIAAGKNVYGASNKVEVDAVTDPNEKAAKLARELIGDYGNITHAGQWLRRHLLPFYAWMEINAPRYIRLMRNLKHEGQGARRGSRILGLASAKFGWKAAKLGAKASALYALATIWNRLFFADEDDELGESQRRQLHLILGRRDDGSIISLRFQGALSDALSWFGGEDIVEDAKDVVSGKVSAATWIKEAALAPVIKIINAVRPDVKGFAELLSGKTFWPDPFNPRPIRDKLEHILRSFSLEKPYRWLVGKPMRGDTTSARFINDLISLGVYTSDPGESAYYDIRSKTYDWLESQGVERPSGTPTKRGTALYYYKQALKYGDLAAAHKYLLKYKKLGGSMKGIKISVKRVHPLGNLSKKDWHKFLSTLSPGELERYRMALDWYNATYKRTRVPFPSGAGSNKKAGDMTYRQAREILKE